MNIEVFTLCDGAFNYSGKLTIIGTYDQLNVQSVPISAKVSLAVKLCFDENEVHNGTTLKVSYKNPMGAPIAADVINTIGVLPESAQVRHVAMAISTDINISEVGAHSVELYVDDVLVRKKNFDVAVIVP